MKDYEAGGSFALSVVKGTLISLAVSLLCAFAFALLLRFFPIPDKAILPVDQTLKAVAVFVGALSAVRGEKGLFKGALIGIFSVLLSYLAFSAIGGDFSLSWLIVLELLFGALSGGLAGIFAVNARRA